jgi:hypothetical protein
MVSILGLRLYVFYRPLIFYSLFWLIVFAVRILLCVIKGNVVTNSFLILSFHSYFDSVLKSLFLNFMYLKDSTHGKFAIRK